MYLFLYLSQYLSKNTPIPIPEWSFSGLLCSLWPKVRSQTASSPAVAAQWVSYTNLACFVLNKSTFAVVLIYLSSRELQKMGFVHWVLMLSRLPPRLLLFSCIFEDGNAIFPFLVFWYFAGHLWTSVILASIVSTLRGDLQIIWVWWNLISLFWGSIVPCVFRPPDHSIVSVLVTLMTGHVSYFSTKMTVKKPVR